MPRILITGVTGFVGTNLVEYFLGQEQYSLVGHCRNIKKAHAKFDTGRLEIVDDYSARLLNEWSIDCVIHLAGVAHDLSNKFKPEDYYNVNTEGSKRIYDEFLKSNATKFIFVSSIKAVVDMSNEPVTEDVAPRPVTAYGKSKLKAEEYIVTKAIPGKHYYILRPGMIHGPGNKGNLNLLYRFAKVGIPYPFGAFENKRSFLSIDNLTFVMHRLLIREIPSGIYHLADDGFLSTKELYKVITSSLGKRSRIVNIPKSWILFFVSLFGKRHLVNKLTESMMISNTKLVSNLSDKLPVAIHEGIRKTIQSFKKK